MPDGARKRCPECSPAFGVAMKNTKIVSSIRNGAVPRKAMVLAAGLGKRMRPLTLDKPKPLIEVHGKPLLDHGIDALVRAGVEEVVVNIHYCGDQIIDHVSARKDVKIVISDERDQLLDSGGGIVNALPKLGKQPFFLINADTFWVEGFQPNLRRLAHQWNAREMDILLLLAGMTNAVGFNSKGDFDMDPQGKLTRRIEGYVAPFAYAGAAIINPKIFENAPDGAFTLNRQFDEAIEKERLYGMRMDGLWLHVGTPEAIREAEAAIAASAA